MLCDICNKKKAKIYYTEIINGEKREQHICEDCAAEYSNFIGKGGAGGVSIGNILSGILGSYAKGKSEKKDGDRVCSQCGMTEKELLSKGKFGCMHCYDTFGSVIGNNLRVIQGADMHFGKRPAKQVIHKINEEKSGGAKAKPATDKKEVSEKKSSRSAAAAGRKKLTKLEELQLMLQKAIAIEEYEEAAKLRDEIKAIRDSEEAHGKVVSKEGQ